MPHLILANDLISLSTAPHELREAFEELCANCAEHIVSTFKPCRYRHCYQDIGGHLYCSQYDEVGE